MAMLPFAPGASLRLAPGAGLNGLPCVISSTVTSVSYVIIWISGYKSERRRSSRFFFSQAFFQRTARESRFVKSLWHSWPLRPSHRHSGDLSLGYVLASISLCISFVFAAVRVLVSTITSVYEST